MTENQYWVSKKGYQKLEEQYDEILKEEVETQRQIGESVKMDNDLRENPDYMSLQTKAVSELKYKLNKVKEVINNCKIIEDSSHYQNFDETIVTVGSLVTIQFEGDNELEEYTILGYGETNIDENIISYLSPLAQALLNKEKGETFTFQLQSNAQRVTVIKISKGIL